MAVGAKAKAYWLIRRLNESWSGRKARLIVVPVAFPANSPFGWQLPSGYEQSGDAKPSSAGSSGSARATALTQATRVAATKAAKRTRIGRSVGRGYLPRRSPVKRPFPAWKLACSRQTAYVSRPLADMSDPHHPELRLRSQPIERPFHVVLVE